MKDKWKILTSVKLPEQWSAGYLLGYHLTQSYIINFMIYSREDNSRSNIKRYFIFVWSSPYGPAQLRSPEGVKSGGRTIPKSYSSLIRLLVSRQIIIDLRNLQCQIVINQQTNLRETLACGRVRRIALRKLKLEESRGEKEKKKVSRFLGVELTLVQVSGTNRKTRINTHTHTGRQAGEYARGNITHVLKVAVIRRPTSGWMKIT